MSQAETSPTARGRILAVFYLILVGGGIAGQAVIADSLVVPADAARTAANITANENLYRLAFAIFMIEMAAQIAVSMLFYDLLKPVNRSVARLSMLLGLTGAGIKTMARLFFYAPLLILSGAPYLSTIAPAQLETLAYLFIRLTSACAGIGLIFFGFSSVLNGWLIVRSDFLPRFLGVVSMIGGLGWLTWVWPPLGSRTFMMTALFALAGVFLTCGWLMVRGVNDAKWKARAELAAASIWR